mmetsp:Transcript_49725/g.118527  ORF Transcript_49725/g.118527 Transcript_49725/m.118527 type:complete len:626 (+) Transcript_49725:78-1955(+)
MLRALGLVRTRPVSGEAEQLEATAACSPAVAAARDQEASAQLKNGEQPRRSFLSRLFGLKRPAPLAIENRESTGAAADDGASSPAPAAKRRRLWDGEPHCPSSPASWVKVRPPFSPRSPGTLHLSTLQRFQLNSFILPASRSETAVNPAIAVTAPDSCKLPPAVDWQEQITAIYRRKNPGKIQAVAALLAKYKDSEGELYVRICNKYGLDPHKWYADSSAWEAAETASPPRRGALEGQIKKEGLPPQAAAAQMQRPPEASFQEQEQTRQPSLVAVPADVDVGASLQPRALFPVPQQEPPLVPATPQKQQPRQQDAPSLMAAVLSAPALAPAPAQRQQSPADRNRRWSQGHWTPPPQACIAPPAVIKPRLARSQDKASPSDEEILQLFEQAGKDADADGISYAGMRQRMAKMLGTMLSDEKLLNRFGGSAQKAEEKLHELRLLALERRRTSRGPQQEETPSRRASSASAGRKASTPRRASQAASRSPRRQSTPTRGAPAAAAHSRHSTASSTGKLSNGSSVVTAPASKAVGGWEKKNGTWVKKGDSAAAARTTIKAEAPQPGAASAGTASSRSSVLRSSTAGAASQPPESARQKFAGAQGQKDQALARTPNAFCYHAAGERPGGRK